MSERGAHSDPQSCQFAEELLGEVGLFAIGVHIQQAVDGDQVRLEACRLHEMDHILENHCTPQPADWGCPNLLTSSTDSMQDIKLTQPYLLHQQQGCDIADATDTVARSPAQACAGQPGLQATATGRAGGRLTQAYLNLFTKPHAFMMDSSIALDRGSPASKRAGRTSRNA